MSKTAKVLSDSHPALFALPESQLEPITPEIDNLEDEEIGEAVLKDFVPGIVYFDYQDILNQKVAKAENEEDKRKAIYNAQVWLLCQVYEVVEPDGKVRPLGLQDVSFMEGEELAFRIADVMSVNLSVNFLDEKDSLETSWLFEITEKAQRFRVHKLSVEKGVEIQQQSQKDPTGVKLTKWLITERITLNDEKIKDEDFNDKLDFQTTVLLASKINFLLAQFQRKGTSFYIRNTQGGRTKM
jgi:hypothetical protein